MEQNLNEIKNLLNDKYYDELAKYGITFRADESRNRILIGVSTWSGDQYEAEDYLVAFSRAKQVVTMANYHWRNNNDVIKELRLKK